MENSALLRIARHAMATRFEIVIPGAPSSRSRAVAEEALDEIERIEAQLSFYLPTSEISALNRDAGQRPVRVNPDVFQLLRKSVRFSQETQGAFDITVAPLLRAWGFAGGNGHAPSASELATARSCVGSQHVRFDDENQTVQFDRPGVQIDLGSIGKGYALDCAAGILRDHEITSALLHGGTSTIIAIGSDGDGNPWKIALPPSAEKKDEAPVSIELQDASLSVSAVWGKSFDADGKRFGHIIDPTTGEPTQTATFAAVMHASATVTDALSTALLVRGRSYLPQLRAAYPALRAWVG